MSEGRGTTKPFQTVGNPDVNARDIINYFEKNVRFRKFRNKLLDMENIFI